VNVDEVFAIALVKNAQHITKKEIEMNVIDYNIKEMEKGFELTVIASSPSPHWTHIGLCVINHQSTPEDSIQEIILEGSPPNSNYQLTNLQKHTITAFITYKPWLKSIKIRNSLGDVLKNIKLNFSPIKTHNLTDEPIANNEGYIYNELHFATPKTVKTNQIKLCRTS